MKANQPAKSNTTESFYQKLGKLHFWNERQWQPLPSWALYYLELGSLIGLQSTSQDTRFVLALAVPSRAYAGSLIAAGCTIARAMVHDDPLERNRHISWLHGLASGTPVLIREKDVTRKGKFQRIVNSNGSTYYMVRYDSGANTTKGFKPEQIQPLDKNEIKLPKSQKGRARQNLAPLITGLLGDAVEEFSNQTSLDCVLVGTVTELEQEIKEQRLALGVGRHKPFEGVLCDILRPKRFLRTNSAYRSHILPSSNSRIETFAIALSPHIVILDGSLSYLNQRHAWQTGHLVVIFDQTEPQFEAAISQVNQEYYRRSNQEPVDIKLPLTPAGVEAMLFEVSP